MMTHTLAMNISTDVVVVKITPEIKEQIIGWEICPISQDRIPSETISYYRSILHHLIAKLRIFTQGTISCGTSL